MGQKEGQKFLGKIKNIFRGHRRHLVLFVFFIFILFRGFHSEAAQAATLYFSPTSGDHNIGQNFSVGVYVSSKDQAVNAIQGVVSFPADKLQLTSLSKSGSIISLWVQEPTATAGGANFEGIALNPGFTGDSGKVITLNFKVKAAGEAQVTFTSGSILANDGQGTNILSGLGSATFSLGSVPAPGLTAPESTSQVERAGTLPAPVVTSPTHPNPTKWYNKTDPQFEWSLPKDATGASFLFTKISTSNPGTQSDGLVSSHTYRSVDDGIWYFHLRLRNAQGWGSITHFRFQIDTEPPQPFDIQLPKDAETDPRLATLFYTTDELSGLDFYRIRVGDGDPVDIDASKITNGVPYILPTQEAGKHTLYVRAFDKAGNVKTAVADFVITALGPPEITEYPKELFEGDILAVKGKTFPSSEVTMWLQLERDDPKSQTAHSDAQGNFQFIADERVKAGVYKLWAESVDKRGARSNPSDKVIIPVRRSALMDFGSKTVSLVAIGIQFVALIVFILILTWYTWHRIRMLRHKIGQEVKNVENEVHRAFDILRDDVRKHLKLLERVKSKRELTAEEEKIIKQLRKDLDMTEQMVNKKIEKIETDIK